jgi:hypothetical protein
MPLVAVMRRVAKLIALRQWVPSDRGLCIGNEPTRGLRGGAQICQSWALSAGWVIRQRSTPRRRRWIT